ncbi:101 kDa malaria antigen-like isoform X2 [Vespula maculifrons]|uniref:101 kDa malaria antigen-like isoform X2 n=1 Tax=Vespula maculifrons TaxID=7453 RepID=A0ABD2CAW0_VESMC
MPGHLVACGDLSEPTKLGYKKIFIFKERIIEIVKISHFHFLSVLDKFPEDCLDAHNRYRAIHGSEPLQIEPKLVWKETKFMGFGMVTSPTGQIYIVCNYDPPGNVEEKFAENVLPPKEEEEESLAY